MNRSRLERLEQHFDDGSDGSGVCVCSAMFLVLAARLPHRKLAGNADAANRTASSSRKSKSSAAMAKSSKLSPCPLT